MNISALLEPNFSAYTQPAAYDSTSPAYVATSVQDRLVLPPISETYQQPNAEQHPYTGSLAPAALPQRLPAASKHSVACGQHGPAVIGTESNRVQTAKIMMIKDQKGHHVEIPIDVISGSKEAFEKRKRQAKASAEFRARRKDKEQETSMNIARLKEELEKALEDQEHYRTERDYFKSIALQQPNAEQHCARPPSPRLGRHSSISLNAPSYETDAGSAALPYSRSLNSPGPPVNFPSVNIPPPPLFK